jgi:RNA polymerase sigma-70 factor (ECF subfamily)
MLGDLARTEDMAQETWIRWSAHEGAVDSPKAFLVTVITRLCLNELGSARARREESRADRLPEPVDLDSGGMARIERLEQVSMAFLVLLQRLSPAERAVLLLHDVFDFDHGEIAALVGHNAPSCRKLLERARVHVASDRRMLAAPEQEHRRLLRAFVDAAGAGDVAALTAHLARDAVMITDGGAEGRATGGVRNLPKPLHGADHIAAFVANVVRRAGSLEREERLLNGQPAIVFWAGEHPFAALLLAVSDGVIQRVFFHADTTRLRSIGPRATARPSSPSSG